MSRNVQVSVGIGGIGKICVWIDEGEIGIRVGPAHDKAGGP